jgi:hypothetical protein
VTPSFSEAERAAIAFLMASGRPLAAELLVTKLQLRALFEYVSECDRPLRQNLTNMRLIIQGCNTVGKLQLARKELEASKAQG